jgi:hypothetical protein
VAQDLGLRQLAVKQNDRPNRLGRRKVAVQFKGMGVEIGAPVVNAVQHQRRTASDHRHTGEGKRTHDRKTQYQLPHHGNILMLLIFADAASARLRPSNQEIGKGTPKTTSASKIDLPPFFSFFLELLSRMGRD